MKQRYSIVGNYGGLKPKTRFDILYREYSTFPQKMNMYKSTIEMMISSEKACARRDAIGDLGVRIQSGRITSIVEQHALENIAIEQFINAEEQDESFLKDVQCAAEILAAVRELKIMHLEYSTFRKTVNQLPEDCKGILLPYIEKTKDVYDIADEMGVSLETVRSKIKRIKKEISYYMEGAMNEYDENMIIIGGIA